MEAVLVESSHPHVSTECPCGAEQTHDPRAEPACHSGLPYASHALGSGGVAEAEEQRRRVATGSEGLKPGEGAHQVGLHLAMGISPNVCWVVTAINDDTTHNVQDMDGRDVEIHIATRDDSGAKGVTIRTGRDKQLQRSGRQCSWRR